jgi:branched-subunit amino acid transport protein
METHCLLLLVQLDFRYIDPWYGRSVVCLVEFVMFNMLGLLINGHILGGDKGVNRSASMGNYLAVIAYVLVVLLRRHLLIQ